MFSYDPSTLGIVSQTDPNGHTSTMTYDASANLLTTTDALGRTTTSTYNSLNEPLTVTDPLGVTTTMVYDSHGNLLSSRRLWWKQPGNLTDQGFDLWRFQPSGRRYVDDRS